MPKKIKTIVHKDGSVNTEFSGFDGDACLTEEADIERILAGEYGINPPKIRQERKITTSGEAEKIKI
jgi:hypothetical protein